MTIHVFDRYTVEKGLPLNRRYVLISIFDPDSRKGPARLPVDPNRIAVLQLGFHSALLPAEQQETEVPEGIVLLGNEQIRQVVEFVEEHRHKVPAIVVHCNFGMQRSPAVAAAIAEHLGEDSRGFWKYHDPDQATYELLKRAFRKCRKAIDTPP